MSNWMEERAARDKETVTETCRRCGKQYQIKFGSWRRIKDNNYYCQSCHAAIKKEKFDALPEEERQAYLAKKNAAISKGHKSQTPEQRALSSQHRSEAWKKDKARQERHQQWLRERWGNATEEELKANSDRLLAGQKEFWANKDNWKAQSDRARKKWFDQPIEEQERILSALYNGRDEYFASLTPEQKLALEEKRLMSMLQHYQSMTDEDRNQHAIDMQKWMSNGKKMNSLEKEFYYMLTTNGIREEAKFNYISELIHPEFKEKFPSNPYYPNRGISPYHVWDFRLDLMHGSVYIDIDGSIHDGKSTKSPISDNSGNGPQTICQHMAFYDSQRPYKTDGLPAYIIKAYNGKLTSNTPVISLRTNEEMTLKSLMTILWAMNTPKDEVKKLFNEI